jgi:hypothetical protein
LAISQRCASISGLKPICARLLKDGAPVLLERQQPAPPGEPFTPLVKRDCSSFEQGRRGTAVWAARHEARIRAEVAARIATRPRYLWVGR